MTIMTNNNNNNNSSNNNSNIFIVFFCVRSIHINKSYINCSRTIYKYNE